MKSLKQEFSKYVCFNILGMLGLSFYILADTYFISAKLGSVGLTSLNIAIPVYSLISALGIMIGIGGSTRYSIYQSQQHQEQANQMFTFSILLGVILGICFLLIGIFCSTPIAYMLGAREEILPNTSMYLKTIMSFAPFFLLNNIFIAYIRNDFAPKLSMIAMLTGSFSNIILDYVFMFPLNMGMFGAAFATGLSPVISLLILMSHFFNPKHQLHFHFQRSCISFSALGSIISLGISSFINEFSSGIVLIIFNLLILHYTGNTGVAAYGIVANLSLISVAVFTGIAQGSQPLISSYYGKGDSLSVKKLYSFSCITAFVLGIFIVLGIYIFTNPLIAIFNSEQDEQLKTLAFTGLRLYFIGFFFAGINIVSTAWFSAVEQAKKAFILSFFRGAIGIIAVVILLSSALQMTGIWLAFPTTELLCVILCFFFLYHYKKKRV